MGYVVDAFIECDGRTRTYDDYIGTCRERFPHAWAGAKFWSQEELEEAARTEGWTINVYGTFCPDPNHYTYHQNGALLPAQCPISTWEEL